jgi:hypothetical protein
MLKLRLCCECVGRRYFTQWQAVVNAVMNIVGSHKGRTFFVADILGGVTVSIE